MYEKTHTLPYVSNEYISNWGAFGDFIGGTLNPLLTFISIGLILFTVIQNKKSLDLNSEELALSRKAQQDSANSQQLIQQTQNLQQFDSLFFNLLNQFKQQQSDLCFLDEDGKSKVDKIYRSIFIDGYKLELESKREKLLEYQELNQYFICLFQLFKLINTKINRIPNTGNKIEECGDFTLEKQYTNILRSLIPPKLQQLLFLNTYTEFDEYRWYLSYYSFFEHMPFKDLVRNNVILIDLLIISKFYKLDSNQLYGDYQVFGNSIYFNKLLSESCYSEFMESEDLFLSAWEFIENRFFNFKRIVCFFNSVSLSNLDKDICYRYYLINLKNEELRIEVIDVFRNSLEQKLSPRSREKVQLKNILFKNYGFQIQMEDFEKLDFYIYDEICVVLTTPNRSRNLGINENNQANFLEIELKENPL